MEQNAGPECVQCTDGKDNRGKPCRYCQGQGRVQSLEQWVAAGKPRSTPKQRK